MKKSLLFLIAVLFAALSASAQCDAPTNVQASPHYNHVNLTWESSLLDPVEYTDSVTYGTNTYTTGIGTNSAAVFEVAVRFPVESLAGVNGQYLTHVSFIPASLSVTTFTIKVYTGGSHPDATTYNTGTLVSSVVVYPEEVTAGVQNIIRLGTPVLVNASEELWIAYECNATGDHPAAAGTTNVVSGANDLLGMSGQWGALPDYGLTGYAWCIAGYFSDPPAITGFNVFRDNVQINTALVNDHSYVDNTVLPQTQYCYTIQSVCSSTTSNSDPTCVTTPIQPNCGPIVGNGTGTTYLIPFNTFYRYSYSQQIFTAAELGVSAGTIASLSFHYFFSTPLTQNNITIYLANVSQSTFASTSDWIPASELTQVYQGSIYCSNADSNLVTIDFDEAFEWDGHSNIVVAFLNGQGTYETSDARFYTHTTTGNTVLYAYNDNNTYNIASPGTGNLSTSRNNMKFCFGPEPSCYKPTHLTVLSTTGDGATLSWQRHNSNDSQWEVVVVPAGDNVNTGTPVLVNDTTYTVTGLAENTPYDVYVHTYCSQADQSVWVTVDFRTRCTSIHTGVPYYDPFTTYGTGHDAFPYCWQRFSNYDGDAYPYITSASATTGQMVFISNATTYSLAVSQGMDLSAYPAGSLALSYWIAQSQAYYGRMDIGIMTDPNDLNTFTLLRSYYPTDYNQVGYFQEDIILLPENYPNTIYMAFLAPASGNNSTNMVHLSRVKVDLAPDCTAPSNLSVSHVEGTSAILNWQEAPIAANSYTLAYGEVGQAMNSITVNGDEYMLTGLTQGTAYDVMLYSNCASGEADTLTANFTTLAFIECLQPDTNANVITGATATTTYNLPVNNYYNYTYSQQIYTADEIDSTHTPCVITGIAFDYGYSSQNTDKTDVKIYLAHRNTSSFSSTTDWTPISDATLVYEGDLICSQGWNTFNFDTYFPYNGNDNLVVIVDDNSGNYDGSSYVFNAHTLTTYSSMYYYNDGTNPDPANPPTASARSYNRNDVKFFRCSQTAPMSCPRPYVYVTDANDESITIAWQANGTENEWNLEYKAEGANTWTSEGTVSTSPTTINNLTSDVYYDIRLQAVCAATDSSEWAYTTAYTPCESVELPITENFDSYNNNEIPACWIRRSNTATAAPYINSAQAYSGSKSLYFYCPSNGNYAYAISPRLNESVDMDNLMIMFYAYTATAGYFIEVGIMSDPDDLNSFTTLGQFNPSNIQTWELGEIISRDYEGDGHYVAFRVPQWYANNIYIDDINIEEIPSCMHVLDIQASNITPTSADVSWTAGGSESQWNYIVGPAGTVDPTEDTPILSSSNTVSISGLNGNTLYEIYVQAYCSASEQSSWMHSYFRTECAAMTTLPYEENFDTYTGTTSTATNVLPNCWSRINGGTSYAGLPTIYNSSAAAHSGNNSLYFYTYYTTAYADQYAILPDIDTTAIPMNTLQLSFAARSYSTSYTFNIQVGVMTDPTDPTSFQLVQLVPVSGTAYTNQEVYFDNFTGNGNYVALKVEQPTSGYNYGYIDDIVLDEIPSCSPIHNLTVNHIAGTSALISWESGHFGTVSSYSLEYSEAGQDNWNTVSNNITGTSYMLGSLQPTTSYDVRVRTNCDDNSESEWTEKTFTTRCLAGGEFAIGNGTSTNSYLPSYSTYNYSYTQQIFTAAEMGGAANISSVSFELVNLSQQRTFKIYMMHTTETDITAWIPTANAQLVFDDNQTLVTGWNTFNFTTPFAYNGTDNLLLIVVDETGSWVSGNSWRVHSGTSNCSRYVYQDSAPYSIANVPSSSGTASSNRNNVIFGGNCDSTATCFAPNMYVDNIDTVSADIIWVPGYDESAWELEYTLYGDSTWTPLANPTGGLYALEQLSPNTHYSVRMRSVCGGGDYSAWTVADFRTECGLASIPFAENFNSYGTGNNAFPDCWTKHNTYSTTPYPYITSTNNSGTTGGSLYYYASATSYDIAVMPELNTDVNTLEVSFYLRVGSASNGMIVGVMNNANDFDGFVPVDTVFCSATGAFEYQEVDLDSYTGTGRFIAFKSYTPSAGALYFDDLNVSLIPSCKRPGNVTASNMDMTSAVIAWTERGNATAWEIEYGPVGFTPGTGTTVQASTNPFTLTGLTSGTEYDVYVRANCGGGDISEVSMNHATFATALCDATDQCQYTFVCEDSYGDGWNGGAIAVQQNGVTVATVTFDDGSSYTAHVMLCDNVSTSLVWIEGNYDDECHFTLTDPAGTVLYSSSTITSGTLFTFTTDCNATPPACDAPTNVTTANVTYNAADVNWTAGGNETAWNIQYKTASAASWSNSISVTAPTYHLSGLTAETQYQVRVQAVCSTTETSDWTTASFTTPAAPVNPCNAPTNLQVTNNTQTSGSSASAVMTWTAGGSETTWKVGYKLATASQWQEATVQQTTYVLEGLTPESTYDVRVKAVCAADNESDFITSSFTTLPVGIDNITLASNISLMPNPADNYIELTVNSNVEVKEAVVFNAFGQMIQTVELTDNHARIDLSNMASGMYFVRVSNDTATATKKFIKK